MGVLERMVILPETRSGRMKLRWVNWLTNWITSVRSRLSNDIITVRALLWISDLSTWGISPGSVARVAVGAAGAGAGCGRVAGGGGCARVAAGGCGRAGPAGRGGCCAALGGRTPGRIGAGAWACGRPLASVWAREGVAARSAATGSRKGQRT